ncbi:PDZ domain-containing protein [Chitinophagaceae bacterium LB-8]|uniref:PDZ domain-containing protein n=1 Tax=Paraflavisolibacter caeni TaxID=2982496 RepID=A0A9X2XYN5_9BACT|nr:PDZ domain-containing protein [Paraflavisolibacter caeni]MCU7551087.1 PDZ domain-containing protein [Paraflavisolibacter caeni]
MKQFFTRRILLAGAILVSAPASLLAQDNTKDKVKNTDVEQIIITRKGDDSKKTVIEIQGDKVMINGKNVNDIKDGEISVRLKKVKDMDALVEDKVRRAEERARRAENMDMNFDFDFDDNGNMSFFHADSNRAMLGVMTDTSAKGAVVKSVTKESAAEKAGLKVGDIITSIDNKKVESPADVTENVRKHKPGDKISLSILRDGKKQNLNAELGKWQGVTITTRGFRMKQPVMPPNPPGVDEMPFFYKEGYMGGNGPKLGISIQDSEDGKGVKVLDVDEESNAAKAGIKEGDVITRINDKEIKSVDEVAREVRQNRDKTSLNFQILRKGKTQNIEVKIPRKLKTADL